MKTVFMNFKICNMICAIFTKLLCFIKKRKKSHEETSHTMNNVPLSTIQIQGAQKTTNIDLVDWNNWGDEASNAEHGTEEQEEPSAAELFKDMEPTIDKTKVVKVKRTIRVPSTSGSTNDSPFAFQSKFSDNRKSRYTPKYQVEAELGTMDDEDEGGWDDDLDDMEISKETDNMLRQNKQLERQRRAEEQRRKKLEREQHRSVRKQDSIGVKIT